MWPFLSLVNGCGRGYVKNWNTAYLASELREHEMLIFDPIYRRVWHRESRRSEDVRWHQTSCDPGYEPPSCGRLKLCCHQEAPEQ